jgi:hypothetical protein
LHMRDLKMGKQTRYTSPCKGEVGEQSEPGGGRAARSRASRAPHPTTLAPHSEAKVVDLPLQGRYKETRPAC